MYGYTTNVVAKNKKFMYGYTTNVVAKTLNFY